MRQNTKNVSVLVGVMALQASGPLPAFLTGALGVQIKAELGFDDQTLGLLLGAYFFTFALFAIHSGRLVDSIGARRATFLATAGTTASLLGIAAFARSTMHIALFLTIAGLAGSVGLPTSNRVIARALPPHRMGLSFGLKMAAVPISTLFAGASVPTIALTVGWRWAMVAATVFPLVAVAVQTMNARLAPDGFRGDTGSSAGRARFDRMLWTIIAAGFAGTTAAGAFNAFLIVASVERGVNPGTAGWIAAFTSGLAVVLRPLFGLVADHRHLDGFRFSALLLGVGCFGFIALAIDRSAGLLLVGALLGYGAGWGWSGLIQMAVVETYPAVPAAATGAMALGLALGQGVGPVLFGATAIRFGFNVAWLGVTVTAAIAAVLMMNAAALRRRSLGLSSKEV